MNFLHMYFFHFGAWVSMMFGISLHRDGIPELSAMPKMFRNVLILAAILSLFSSHSHHHYNLLSK